MPKIKIKSIPNKGDQINYELANSPNLNSKKNNNSNSTSNVYPESDNPNVIAEKGETILYNNDGDLTHQNISGKKHFEGGTPINVPDGSFIFSDDKKLSIKDPEILKIFEMSLSGNGYTPAKIAKKYKINDFIDSQKNDDTNRIGKDTSQLNVKNATEKLLMLANIQESMKGFPSGPVTFADDNLIYAGSGGNITPSDARKLEEEAIKKMRAETNIEKKIAILNEYKSNVSNYRANTKPWSWGWVKGSDENTFSDIDLNLERKIKYLEIQKTLNDLNKTKTQAEELYAKDKSIKNLNLLKQVENNITIKNREKASMDYDNELPYFISKLPKPLDISPDYNNWVDGINYVPVTGEHGTINTEYNKLKATEKTGNYNSKSVNVGTNTSVNSSPTKNTTTSNTSTKQSSKFDPSKYKLITEID